MSPVVVLSLNLTAEQRSKIAKIRNEVAKNVPPGQHSTSFTPIESGEGRPTWTRRPEMSSARVAIEKTAMKNPLATKASFYKFSVGMFGVPCAVIAVVLLGRDGDYSQWLVLAALGLSGGLLWAILTWPYFREVNRRLHASAPEKSDDGRD